MLADASLHRQMKVSIGCFLLVQILGPLHLKSLAFFFFFLSHTRDFLGFPCGAGGIEHSCQCRKHKRHGFDPWVRRIPWRRAWHPTPGFLSGESHEQRNLVGYSPWVCRELEITEATWHTNTQMFLRQHNSPNNNKTLIYLLKVHVMCQ